MRETYWKGRSRGRKHSSTFDLTMIRNPYRGIQITGPNYLFKLMSSLPGLHSHSSWSISEDCLRRMLTLANNNSPDAVLSDLDDAVTNAPKWLIVIAASHIPQKLWSSQHI